MSTTDWAEENLPPRPGEDLAAAELSDGVVVIANPGDMDQWVMGDGTEIRE